MAGGVCVRDGLGLGRSGEKNCSRSAAAVGRSFEKHRESSDRAQSSRMVETRRAVSCFVCGSVTTCKCSTRHYASRPHMGLLKAACSKVDGQADRNCGSRTCEYISSMHRPKEYTS